MIVITARFTVKPEHAERWPAIAKDFTHATRAEPGCLWFDWSRSVDDPEVYVLVEAFADEAAGAHHVGSEHFREAQRVLPPHLARTPEIVHVNDRTLAGWSELGELRVE